MAAAIAPGSRRTRLLNANNDRDYVEVGPKLTYELFESLRVGAYYRYRWVDRQDEGSGSSNAVGITLTYQPLRRL